MQLKWENPPFGTDDLEPGAADGYRSSTSPLRRGTEVRCCVRDCRTWLRSRSRKIPTEFCPDHGISISTSPTYVYKDWKKNFLLQHDLLAAVKQHKVESWRLGNESSEDALSWNVFVGLAYLGGLREAFEVLTGRRAQAEPQLFFWGMEVWPAYQPGAWSRLNDARAQFGEQGSSIPTEPDIMLRVGGQAVVLIEAKFGSPNGTLAKKRDMTVSKFLNQYHSVPGRDDPLDREAIRTMQQDQVLEQLCRNVVFSNYMAEGGEEACVASLVRGEAETDVEKRMERHLSSEARARFRRVAWESLGRLPSLQRHEAATLRSYLRAKTLRLRPALKLEE